MSTVPPDAEALLADVAELARASGSAAWKGRLATAFTVDTKSSATDLVTKFDRAAEELIVDGVRRRHPLDSIVGEEGTDHAGTSGRSWFIDPIDGTTNFVYALPQWATSIGVSDGDGMLVGAVYVPPNDELFTAVRGRGAWLDGRPIRCSAIDDPALALVATGFGYLPERRRRQAARVQRLIGSVRDIRRLGAASVDLCYVACGRLDAYYEEHINSWDMAAGELVAREAGCRSSDFAGGPPRPAEVLVSAPGIHDELRSLIARADPDGASAPASP
jgi:myo-inositol-1(or 4)-monophosphatase